MLNSSIMLNDYLSAIENEYGKEPAALLLLAQAGGFAFSFLREYNCRPTAPVAVITDKMEKVDSLAKFLGIFSDKSISSGLAKGKFLKELKSRKDEAVVIIYEKTRNSSENIEALFRIYRCGQIEEENQEALFIIVFEGVVPKEYDGRFSCHVVVENGKMQPILPMLKERFLKHIENYMIDKHQVIEDRLNRLKMELESEEYTDSAYLESLFCLVKSAFEYESMDAAEVMSGFEDCLGRAMERAQDNEMSNIIVSKLRERIIGYMREHPLCVSPRGGKRTREVGSQNNMILFDEQYLYLSRDLLGKIGASSETYCSLDELERMLAKEGILAGQNGGARNYWTVKLSDADGKRYLRIRRSFIEKAIEEQELTLEELYGEGE